MNRLDNLYREIILDHYRTPRNRGHLPVPPAGTARGYNPLCGDEITVYVIVDNDSKITRITTEGYGCSISQASASMMTMAVKNRTIAEAQNLTRTFKSMLTISDISLETSAGRHRTTDLGKATTNGETEDVTNTDNTNPSIKLGDLESLQGELKFPVRIKCATLCWNALVEAIDNATNG